MKLRFGIALFISVLVFSSCSKYHKLLKSSDTELKRLAAVEYYEKEDYYRAIGLLTDVIPSYRGTSMAEELNYYYAMAHFKQGDYIMAAHYFKTFTQGFPRSEHNEKFHFKSAYCHYLLSPRPSLDQTTTREAIREFQNFANRFPNSERLERVNELMDELRGKLEIKAYNKAKMYYNIRDYVAAASAFNTLIRDFPDTQYREEAMFFIVKAHFDFAENSIEARQLERFSKVLEAHRRLERRFPESEFLETSLRMNEHSTQKIEMLKAQEALSEKK